MAKKRKVCYIKFCGISALDCIVQTYCERAKESRYKPGYRGRPLNYTSSGFFKSMVKECSNREEYTPAKPHSIEDRKYRCDAFGVIRTDTLDVDDVPDYAEGMEKTISKPDCILALWVDNKSPYGVRWKINIDGASIDELTFIQNILPVYDDSIIKALYRELEIAEEYNGNGNPIKARKATEVINKALRLYPEYERSMLQDKKDSKYVVLL